MDGADQFPMLRVIDDRTFADLIGGSSPVRGMPTFNTGPESFKEALLVADEAAARKFRALILGVLTGCVEVKVEVNDVVEDLCKLAKPFQKEGSWPFGRILKNGVPVNRCPSDFTHAGFSDICSAIGGFGILYCDSVPIGGVFEDTLIFPGPLLDGSRLAYLEEAIKRQLQVMGDQFVSAVFHHWVGLMEESAAKEKSPGFPPVWLLELQRIDNEWLRACGFTRGIPRPPELREYVDFNEAGFPVLKPLFCERLIRIRGVPPDVPVRGIFTALVDIQNSYWDASRNCYIVGMKDWENGILEFAPLESCWECRDNAELLLTPRFKTPSWSLNALGFFLNPGEFGARVLDHGGSIVAMIDTTDVERNPAGFFRESAFCVEIVRPADTSRSPCEPEGLGIYKDSRPDARAATRDVLLSLDLGTSASRAAWCGEDFSNIVSCAICDSSWDLVGRKEASGDDLTVSDPPWFPCLTAQSGEILRLPSELVFSHASQMQDIAGALERPLECFRINSERLTDGLHLVLADPKWDGSGQGVLGAYLHLFIFTLLATLRNEGVRGVEVIPSFPLAFSAHQYRNYMTTLGLVCEGLSRDTGITVTPGKERNVLLSIPESRAVAAVYEPGPAESVLIVDVGGGTADIAVIRSLAGDVASSRRSRTSSAVEILINDSVRYAGNLIVDCLADMLIGGNAQQERFNEEDILPVRKQLVMVLRKKIRAGGVRSLYQDDLSTLTVGGPILALLEGITESMVLGVISRYFSGLFYYLRKTLRSRDIKKAALFPAGNGWRFAEVFATGDESLIACLRRILSDSFREEGISVDVIDAVSGLEAATSLGVLRLLARKDCQVHEPDSMPIRAIVGEGVRVCQKISGSRFLTPWRPKTDCQQGLHPYKLLNLDVFFDRLPSPWIRAIGRSRLPEVKGRLRAACANEVVVTNGATSVVIQRSVMGRFLEEVYPTACMKEEMRW